MVFLQNVSADVHSKCNFCHALKRFVFHLIFLFKMLYHTDDMHNVYQQHDIEDVFPHSINLRIFYPAFLILHGFPFYDSSDLSLKRILHYKHHKQIFFLHRVAFCNVSSEVLFE